MSLWGAALGNPRQCGDLKEKVFVGICALLPGLSCFMNGLTTLSASAKYGTEHRLTFILGWFWIIIGSIFTLLGAPAALGVNFNYSKLNDGDLSEAIKTIFQSIPQVAVPCLFVASSSIRCIVNSTPVTPVIEQCGNPAVPSLMATIFMGLIFFLGYVIPPLLTDQHNLTWGDIMAMRFRKREKTQAYLLGALALMTVFQLANVSEDGDVLSVYLEYLAYATLILCNIAYYFAIVVYVAKPLLCSSNTEDENRLTRAPKGSVDSFNRDIGRVNLSFGAF